MPTIPFKQVDVFTERRFKGNPVAVVLQADGLTVQQMQAIANWTNLSETTFVVEPDDPKADYRVRIFTPHAELAFAGHPTIGTAHALLEAGMIQTGNGELVQQCKAGLIRLEVDAEESGQKWIAFELPKPACTPLPTGEAEVLEKLLGAPLQPGCTPHVVDVGPRWLVAQLADAQAVLSVRPDLQGMSAHAGAGNYDGVTIFGPTRQPANAAIEMRSFAPLHGINEDPVCGSGAGCVAAYLRHTEQGQAFGSRFLISQGMAVGRAGLLQIRLGAERIQVGGTALTCIDGTVTL